MSLLSGVHERDRPYVRCAMPAIVANLGRQEVNATILGIDTPEGTFAAYYGMCVLAEWGALALCKSSGPEYEISRCVAALAVLSSDPGIQGIEIEVVLATIACHGVMNAGNRVNDAARSVLRISLCQDSVRWDGAMVVGMAKLANAAVGVLARLHGRAPEVFLAELGMELVVNA